MPDENKDLTRPKISVTIPQVRLTLKDLAYLRGLSQPQEVRCIASSKVEDKLRFLDLIARAKVAPSDEAVASAAKNKQKAIADLKEAIEKELWHKASDICYSLRNAKYSLEPREETVLTEAGKQLLRTGDAVVRARKVGCV